MLWSTLKSIIAQYVTAHPENDGSKKIIAMAEASKQTVRALISDADARQVGELRVLIPAAFPRPLRAGALVADQNIHGAWRVESK